MAEQRNVDYYLSLPYSVRLTPRKEGDREFYAAEIPDLPGCLSDGKTERQALRNIREAQRIWVEAALESRYPIPEPKDYLDYSGKFVVRLPRALHRNLAVQAGDLGVSLNQYIVHRLSEASAVREVAREFKVTVTQEMAALRARLESVEARVGQLVTGTAVFGYGSHALWLAVGTGESDLARLMTTNFDIVLGPQEQQFATEVGSRVIDLTTRRASIVAARSHGGGPGVQEAQR